jgi:hypothetical protein
MKKIEDLRIRLIHLHKMLLENQRSLYERKHGRVRSEAELFRLVTEHRSFSWLRPLSMLIVTIDEALEADFVHPREFMLLRRQAKALLKASREGIDFSKKLDRALQASPDVVMALGEVSRLLKEEVSS